MPAKRVVTVRFGAEELAVLDARAQERGCARSDVLRSVVTAGPPREVETGPLGEADLVGLLEEQARRGNVRAIELLLRRVKQPEPVVSPFDEFDELAARRAG